MKFKAYLFFAAIVLYVFLSLTTSVHSFAVDYTAGDSTQTTTSGNQNLDYERVYTAGIWWVLVFDGSVLIDVYPE